MTTITGSHEVSDFDQWKKAFDRDAEIRSNLGLKTVSISRSPNNPNDVTVTFEAEKPEVMNTILNDPGTKEKMKSAGVLTEPVFKVVNKV